MHGEGSHDSCCMETAVVTVRWCHDTGLRVLVCDVLEYHEGFEWPDARELHGADAVRMLEAVALGYAAAGH